MDARSGERQIRRTRSYYSLYSYCIHTRGLSPNPEGGPIRRTIQIHADDNEWLIRTSVPSYLRFFVDALRQILSACEESSRDQEDIFAGL